LKPGTTTLDRVHIAMLLQAAGKSNALRTMLKAEVDRGPDIVRLANALSALYPKESEEKVWLMLCYWRRRNDQTSTADRGGRVSR